MNIAAYCRVSTDKEDQLNSLETQKLFFEEYAKRNGHVLVRIYADEGITGTKLKARRQFQQMMADAELGMFQMLVVKDISRFARNTVEFLQSVRQLKSNGIETQFITASMTNMGDSEFVLTIFAALAQEESANTSKRIKFTKRINAEKGRVPTQVYGYDKIKGDYFNLTINEREAAVVREIFDMYVNGGLGSHKIALTLNQRGIRTKRGNEWSQVSVRKILANRLYCGVIINGKEEIADFLTGKRVERPEEDWYIVDRPELRIIDQEIFDRAQEECAKRRQNWMTQKERHSSKHLFSTLIKCEDCGHSFRRVVKRHPKRTTISWTCTTHNLSGRDACANKATVNEDELIDVLNEYFISLLSDEDGVIERVVGEFKRLYKERDDDVNLEKELRSSLAKLKASRQKYMDMYTDDIITRDELNQSVSGIKKEIESIERELQVLSYNLSKGDQLDLILRNTFQTIEDVVDVRDMTNAQLKQVIDKITVSNSGHVTIYLKMFGALGLDEEVLIYNNGTCGNSKLDLFLLVC